MTKSECLFLVTVASLPVQLGKIFFPKYSFVLGIPIDYRAIIIYLSDLFILAYILMFLIEKAKLLKKIYKSRKNFIIGVLILNTYLLVNSIFVSVSKEASLYFSLKSIEFGLFALFSSVTLSSKHIYSPFKAVVGLSLLWQSILVLFQFFFQRSQGLWFLGERTFDSSTVSIAHIELNKTQFLRPYGTFSHPNVLGAFFVVFLIIFLSNFGPFQNNKRFKKLQLLKQLTASLSVFSILLTFSKAAIFALVTIFILASSGLKEMLVRFSLLLVLIVLVINLIPESQIASIAERLTLSQAALNIALINPLFGVGSGNFIIELSRLNLFSIAEVRLLQPVHNIFLLILAENGVLGLIIFVFLLFVILKSATSKPKIMLFLALLIFASIDHFFWTLHQGKFIFWFTTAYIVSKNERIYIRSQNTEDC